jgi:hypothetical protein
MKILAEHAIGSPPFALLRKEENTMKYLSEIAVSGVCILGLTVAGCGGGTDVKTETSSYSTTLGQELQDLEDA